MANTLYYGDNLEVLRNHIKDESVDLVYLDPPFSSNRDYNVIFREASGALPVSQEVAFEDTWHWTQETERAFEELKESPHFELANLIEQFQKALGKRNDVTAYLVMMAPRLAELHRILKPTGSIYLHCDTTVSHYLKLLLDIVFGSQNFRNEIIWRRTSAHGARRSFGPIHDTIFFYSKSDVYYFRIVKRPYMRGHVEKRYKLDAEGRSKFTSGGNVLTGAGATNGESGQPWMGIDPSAKNRHWAIPGFLSEQMPPKFMELGVIAKLNALYEAGLIDLNEGSAWPTPVRYLNPNDGQPIQDIWAYQPYTEGTVHDTKDGIDRDVAWLGPTDPERIGYQTQKPLGLLGRIIQASCPDDGIVLDPFCGCGTTIAAADATRRKWIGIDITHLAIGLIEYRLTGHNLIKNRDYQVIGEPKDVASALKLANEDKWQFQYWATAFIGAFPVGGKNKKGADKGIDGLIRFRDGRRGHYETIIVQVKGGQNISVAEMRDLRGVMEREKAAMGFYICVVNPTRPMLEEAAKAGVFKTENWGSFPKIQIRTIDQLFQGKGFDYPKLAASGMKAPVKVSPQEQIALTEADRDNEED